MRFLNKIQIWIFSVLLFCVLFVHAFAQPPLKRRSQENAEERRQFRIAQKLQVANKHEQAAAILEKLYENRPESEQYYRELLESLLSLSRIEEALKLIEKKKTHDPLNPRYAIDYGRVLYKTGKEKEGKKIWKHALEEHRNNVAVFTLVANAMLSHNLFDEAIEVYKRGYELHPKRTYFLQNIASIHRNRFEYSEALEYYLEYLRKEPNRHHAITRQILSMEVDTDDIDDLAKLLEKEAKESPDIPELQMAAAKFYQKYQRFDKALEIYENLENDKTKGKYLMDFGRTMQADSLYQLALRSYEVIANRFPKSAYLFSAYLGAAKCNLELAQLKNEQQYAEKAIGIINLVRQKYPNHTEVAELGLVEGLIYKEFFFDVDKAIEIFKDISSTYAKHQQIFERAKLFLGECYLIRSDLDKAAVTLRNIQSEAMISQALHLLAKIEFYRGNYSESTNYVNRVIQLEGTSGTVTNDALQLQMLLAQAESSPKALELYAEADLLLFQDKKSQAISKMENALAENPPDNLKAQLLLDAAKLSREIGKPNEALEFCNKLIKDSTMITYADEALFLMAIIFEKDVGDLSHAFQLYDRLLIEFPESQFSHKARFRLSQIRNHMEEVMP